MFFNSPQNVPIHWISVDVCSNKRLPASYRHVFDRISTKFLNWPWIGVNALVINPKVNACDGLVPELTNTYLNIGFKDCRELPYKGKKYTFKFIEVRWSRDLLNRLCCLKFSSAHQAAKFFLQLVPPWEPWQQFSQLARLHCSITFRANPMMSFLLQIIVIYNSNVDISLLRAVLLWSFVYLTNVQQTVEEDAQKMI